MVRFNLDILRISQTSLLDVPASPSLQIQAGLEEFRIILATKQARIFDIQVQGIIKYFESISKIISFRYQCQCLPSTG